MDNDKVCKHCGWIHKKYPFDTCPECGKLFSSQSGRFTKEERKVISKSIHKSLSKPFVNPRG